MNHATAQQFLVDNIGVRADRGPVAMTLLPWNPVVASGDFVDFSGMGFT